MKEETVNYATVSYVASATIILLSAVISLSYYFINDRTLMSKNIDSAIARGLDPLSVRCSYADSKDIICIAFAASASSHQPPVSGKK
jgi:hypothetical protein